MYFLIQEPVGVREMRKSISVFAWLSGVAAMLVAGASFAAEGDASKGEAIFKNGKDGTPVIACQSCHGDKAQGNDDMGTPRLAGQGSVYIVKQLNDIAGGKRKPTGLGEQMIAIAGGLSDQEKRDVAAYLHSLKGEEVSDLKDKAGAPYKGQVIVKFGVSGKVSACQSCHGYNGRGASPVFPMIGRQKYVYLVNQLKSWRDGSRANDPAGMMRAVAKNLTDDDINDVAAFLAVSEATTQGNHQTPSQD
jgi:cytochrome c553